MPVFKNLNGNGGHTILLNLQLFCRRYINHGAAASAAKKGNDFMKNKKLWIILGVVALIVIIIVGSIIGIYNSMNSLRGEIENKQANIETQLNRRMDLIPNLVSTVKAYAEHESEVFTAVSEARSKLAGASTVAEQSAANSELTSALNRLIAIGESYPELKANQNFIALQDELAGTENRIATARNDYNEAARNYNTKLRSFPTNLFAGMFGFSEVEYFEASPEAQEAPVVSF